MVGFSRLRFSAYARDLELALLDLSRENQMPSHGWPIRYKTPAETEKPMSNVENVTPAPQNVMMPEAPKPATVITVTEPLKRNVTGASQLGSSIATLIAAIKGEVDAAHADLQSAATDVRNGINNVKGVAKALRTEADDIKSSLGQFSNGGPE